jgi:hypothetical protein
MDAPVPSSVKRLVDRFDQNCKVFLSSDYKEEQQPKAKTPHELESLQRQTDPLVCGSHGLTEDETRIAGGGAR